MSLLTYIHTFKSNNPVTTEQIIDCASLDDDDWSLWDCCFCAEKSLESELARLNRLRSTKVDAAEIAGLTDTAAFSIFSCTISVNASEFCLLLLLVYSTVEQIQQQTQCHVRSKQTGFCHLSVYSRPAFY